MATGPVFACHCADVDFEVWPTTIIVRSHAQPARPLVVAYPFALITRVFADAAGHIIIQLVDGLEVQYQLEPGAAEAACAAFWDTL